MSKKKTILFLTLAAIAALIILTVAASGNRSSGELNARVEVKDSKADPEYAQASINLEKGGTYNISSGWLKNGELPGFVTGLIVYSEDGKEIFKTDGAALSIESKQLELDAGKYLFRYTFLASPESYEAYIRAHYPNREAGDIDYGIFRDGTWSMSYSIGITESRPYLKGLVMACGMLIGCLLIVLVKALSSSGKSTIREFDERELAIREKSFRYGFFALLIYFVLLMFVYGIGVDIPVETPLLIFTGIVIGICVMATYSIINDAYIHDENRKFFYISFGILAIANSVLSILNIVHGGVSENGVLTFSGCCIILCTIAVIYILVVLIIRNIRERENDV